jgi:NitT/TauT family transport system substrate-binding protein
MAKNPFLHRLTAVTALVVVAGAALAGCSSSGSSSTAAGSSGGSTSNSGGGASESIVLGSPGVPPVISGLLPYIADKQGFYKKYGVNVTIKSFDTGTDATRAAATGQIDAAIMPPAQLITLASQGTPVVGLQGQEFPDWVVDSTDPTVNSCTALKGQTIGVDAIGGIRYVALQQMLKTCGLSISDVHPIPFPGNAAPQALINGQLKTSVLHLNEVYDVTGQGKTLTTAITMAKAVPNTMYEMYGTTKTELAQKRDAFVRLVAAQIATIQWMNDPANADAVAQYATVTGDQKADLVKAMAQYREINFWESDSAAMPETNVNNSIQGQIRAGNITAAKAPKYNDIVDLSIFTDAEALVKKTGA